MPSWWLALWNHGQSVWQQANALAQQIVLHEGDGPSLYPYIHAAALGASFGVPSESLLVSSMPEPEPAPAPVRRPRLRRLPPVTWRHYDRLEPLAERELGDEPPPCTITLKDLPELRQPVAVKVGASVQIFEFDDLRCFWWHMPERMGLTPSYTPIKILYRVVRDGAA